MLLTGPRGIYLCNQCQHCGVFIYYSGNQTISITPPLGYVVHHVMGDFRMCLWGPCLCLCTAMHHVVVTTADILVAVSHYSQTKTTHGQTVDSFLYSGYWAYFTSLATFASLVPPQKGASSYSAVNEDDKLEEPLSLLLSPCHKAYCCRQST